MKLTQHKTRSIFDPYTIVNEADVREGLGELAAFHAEQKAEARRAGTLSPADSPAER